MKARSCTNHKQVAMCASTSDIFASSCRLHSGCRFCLLSTWGRSTFKALLNATFTLYGWKQTDRHTHTHVGNTVLLVWGSVRLATCLHLCVLLITLLTLWSKPYSTTYTLEHQKLMRASLRGTVSNPTLGVRFPVNTKGPCSKTEPMTVQVCFPHSQWPNSQTTYCVHGVECAVYWDVTYDTSYVAMDWWLVTCWHTRLSHEVLLV